ncbi:ubiquitin-specific protease [Marasmius crinis-equi]|uniref:Ubiquitin-specific protease n=1 Tax=Marasmius crinis-equi TaxID=585013 RepID=A0ABR3F6X6_9AGAR
MSESLNRYPSLDRAAFALRRLGDPPSSYDRSVFLSHAANPTSPSWKFLNIVGYFVTKMDFKTSEKQDTPIAGVVLKRNLAYITPWIRFLLEAVLVDETEIVVRSSKGYEMVECSLAMLPHILRYPSLFQETGQEAAEEALHLATSAPYLRPLCVDIFLTTIQKNHCSWEPWAYALAVIVDLDISLELPVLNIPKPADRDFNAISPDEIFYLGSYSKRWSLGELSVSIIQHLHRQVRDIKGITLEKAQALHLFRALTRTTGTILIGDPVIRAPIRGLTIPVLDALASAIFTSMHDMTKRLGGYHGWSEYGKRLYLTIANLAMMILADIAAIVVPRGPKWTKELLDGKLMVVILSTGCVDSEQEVGWLLNHIFRNLVCPSVLHAFLKTHKRVPFSRVSDHVRFIEWRKAWEQCTERAQTLKNHCRQLRKELHSVCVYKECPLRHGKERLDDVVSYYRLCSQCKSASYCSPRCQGLHWKGGHREECGKLARDVENGAPSHLDKRFFEYILQYVHDFSGNKIKEGLEALPPTETDEIEPLVAILDFTRPVKTKGALCTRKLLHFSELLKDNRVPQSAKAELENYIRPYQDSGGLVGHPILYWMKLMIGLFPGEPATLPYVHWQEMSMF